MVIICFVFLWFWIEETLILGCFIFFFFLFFPFLDWVNLHLFGLFHDYHSLNFEGVTINSVNTGRVPERLHVASMGAPPVLEVFWWTVLAKRKVGAQQTVLYKMPLIGLTYTHMHIKTRPSEVTDWTKTGLVVLVYTGLWDLDRSLIATEIYHFLKCVFPSSRALCLLGVHYYLITILIVVVYDYYLSLLLAEGWHCKICLSLDPVAEKKINYCY